MKSRKAKWGLATLLLAGGITTSSAAIGSRPLYKLATDEPSEMQIGVLTSDYYPGIEYRVRCEDKNGYARIEIYNKDGVYFEQNFVSYDPTDSADCKRHAERIAQSMRNEKEILPRLGISPRLMLKGFARTGDVPKEIQLNIEGSDGVSPQQCLSDLTVKVTDQNGFTYTYDNLRAR